MGMGVDVGVCVLVACLCGYKGGEQGGTTCRGKRWGGGG